MENQLTIQNFWDFYLYNDVSGKVKVEVILKDETIWLSQKMMARLFDVDVSTINEHIKNIYKSWELHQKATIRKFPIVQKEWNREVSRDIEFYNLDTIIAVGYRVNSKKATSFRIWATNVLKEHIIKGFTLDDERLKNGNHFWKDYFKELLERVRSIRASERRIYQQITDIFEECSIDYDKTSDITKNFFATIQNKFHYAITGKTAAEIIYDEVDNTKPYMWLKTWKNSPDGRILKWDVSIAKNYLTQDEIKKLERTIWSYFDYIENQIEKSNTFTMEQFVFSVNKFLEFNDFQVLWDDDKWHISAQTAKQKAENEYDIFNKTQVIKSDFDAFVKDLKDKK